jgi:dCMP deaminase
MNRISKIEYALEIAKVCALRSEDPHRKVGAVGLSKDGRIVSTGYNGLAPGKEVSESFWLDRAGRLPYVIHAEANMLARCKLGEVHYVACTLSPCVECMKLMIAHGIKEIYYIEEYERDTKAFDLAKFYGITLMQIAN